MHVLLELADRLCAEGVRNCLALASVLGAVAGVEETALDGDEGVIVFAADSLSACLPCLQCCRNLRLQKTIAMPVNGGYGSIIRDRNMTWLDTDERTIFFVCCVYCQITPAPATLPKKPEVAESCWERRRDITDGIVAEPRKEVEEDWKG